MKKDIAFFDFDGTITTKDSLLEIIKYVKGVPSFYIGFGLMSPWILAMKLKIISNTRVKQRVLRYFFAGIPQELFRQKCEEFARDIIPGIIRPKAISEINKHIQQGNPVVIVSASPENFIIPWCRQFDVQCIATKLEVKNDLITGNIYGNNCYGEEKVKRIQQEFDTTSYENIYGYGDTKGDMPMLSFATYSFYKPFRT